MPKTSDIKPTQLKCLTYGKSGTGKTYALDTLPKPLFIYSFDPGGLVSLRGCTEIDYEELEDFKSLDKHLEKTFNPSQYKSLAVDSLTTLAELIMNHVMGLSGKSSSKIATIPTQNHWMTQMVLIQQVLDHFLNLPLHVVITAHEELMKDELSGRIMGVPLITGKLKFRLPLYFSELYHSRIKRQGDKHEYVFMTRDDALYGAKSRMAARAPIEQFELQNYTAIWNKTKGDTK
jgi:hypothetical protein